MSLGKETERAMQNAALLELSRGNVRLFRNNSGTGWVGKSVTHQGQDVLVRHARPLHAGLHKGAPDVIGWTTVEITAAMVGRRVAVFTGIEFKGTGTTTPEQDQFLGVLDLAGGISGIARSSDEARLILETAVARLTKP